MSELRLMPGDWVNCDGAEAFIHTDKDGRLMVQHKFGSFDKFLNTANIEPIPLTADILRDWFGFELLSYHDGVVYFRISQIEFFWQGRSGIYRHHGMFDPVGKEIEFVHQLQHLYEALTGEPLERIDI